ncbi:MAG: hypothetical protein AB1349_04460 [Elusimicrobiota bacterium]
MNIKNLRKNWKLLVNRSVNFQAKIVLTLFYWFVVSFFAILAKIFPTIFNIKNTNAGWQSKKIKKLDLEQAKRQY